MKQELKGKSGKGGAVWRNAFKKAAKKCAKTASKGVYSGPRTWEGLKEVRQRIKRDRATLAVEEKRAIEYYRLHHIKLIR